MARNPYARFRVPPYGKELPPPRYFDLYVDPVTGALELEDSRGVRHPVATAATTAVTATSLAGASTADLPTFADNAAAVTGGLEVTRLYKTATGEVRIVV